MLKFRYTYILFFILNFSFISAQNNNLMLKNWSSDDGLISNAILKIIKTPDSKLFMATYNGIAIFDGKNFSSFSSKNTKTFRTDVISDFCYDKNSSIWIATGKGLLQFKNKKISKIKELKELDNINIKKIEYDNAGNLWIGTISNGLYKYSHKKLIKFENIKAFNKNTISLIYNDLDGSIWIGTERGDLYKYENKKFKKIHSSTKINGIFAALQSKSGKYFFGTIDGIYTLKNNKLKLINTEINSVNDIKENKEGMVWFATNSGVFMYKINKKGNDYYKKADMLKNQIIRTIYFDSEGLTWIGSYRKGLILLRETAFKQISFSKNNIKDIPSHARYVNDKTIWISTDEGNIYKYKEDKLTKLKLKTDLKGSRIKNIYPDTKGNIWICSYKGLVRYNKSKEFCANKKNGFPDNTIREIIEDKEGNYYVSTRQSGIYKIDENFNILKKFNTSNGLSSNFIMALVFDKQGKLYVASKNGINIIENDSVTKTYNTKNGLVENMIFNIFIDKQNIVWVATIDGLSRIKNNKIINYNISAGLKETKLFDIVEDNFNNFWIPIEKGLMRISKKSLNDYAKNNKKKIISAIYSKTDGIIAPQYVGASKMFKTKDGKIIFCTISNINILDPKIIDSFKSKQNLLIEKITTETDTFLINNNPVKLPAFPKYINIYFSYIDFIYPNKANIKYKLEPFDEKWQKAGNYRIAHYSSLTPGNYTFLVKATISTQNNKTIIKTIKFKVLPAFYQTLWFKISTILLFAFIVYLLYMIKVKNTKQTQQLLENEIIDRTKEIIKQKEAIQKQNKELEKQKSEVAIKNDEILIKTNELEQSFLQLKILSDLGKKITSKLSIEKIIPIVYKYISSSMNINIFGIGVFDKNNNKLIFNSIINKNKIIETIKISPNKETCIISYCFNKDIESFSNNVLNDFPDIFKTFTEIISFQTIQSSIIIPIKVKDEKVGIIVCQSYKRNEYTENLFSIIKNISIYIGIAIENTNVYAQIRNQKDELQKVNASKDKLFSLIGHDLRGPVGTIKTFLDLILENPDLSTNKEQTLLILKTMKQSLESAYSLLDNLLLWARSQRGQIEFAPENFIINEAINESINIATDSTKNKNINIKKELYFSKYVFADKNMITTVIRNLISNAVKFTPNNGNITIKTKQNKNELIEISIIDDGIGISEEIIHKILNFNETYTTLGTKNEKGSGLGINICIDFLNRHNQKLLIKSNETDTKINKGSVFKFYLPIGKL